MSRSFAAASAYLPSLISGSTSASICSAARSSDVVLPRLAVEVLRPDEVLLLGDIDHVLAVGVEADADELHAFGVVLVVSRDHVIRLGHAGPAPRRPEIDDDNPAFVIVELDV